MTTMWPMPAAVAPLPGGPRFHDGDLHAGLRQLARAGAPTMPPPTITTSNASGQKRIP